MLAVPRQHGHRVQVVGRAGRCRAIIALPVSYCWKGWWGAGRAASSAVRPGWEGKALNSLQARVPQRVHSINMRELLLSRSKLKRWDQQTSPCSLSSEARGRLLLTRAQVRAIARARVLACMRIYEAA
eukprot:4170084-Alexandrium_andersonii.AAC.1